MGVLLGIDFGLKRTGIAITDTQQRIASPHCTVASVQLMEWLISFSKAHEISAFVLGFPLAVNGDPTHITENVRLFQQALEAQFKGIPVFLQDERYSSKRASASIHMVGKKKLNKDKELLDKVSAALILQDYLKSRENL